jgi:hypothetical protein
MVSIAESKTSYPPDIVFLESPYSGNIDTNTRYASACAIECAVVRDELAYASHLQMTQHPRAKNVFVSDYDDKWDTLTRDQAIKMSQRMRERCDMTVFYVDLGWSKGMIEAREYCVANQLSFDVRKISVKLLSSQVPYLSEEFLKALIAGDSLANFMD